MSNDMSTLSPQQFPEAPRTATIMPVGADLFVNVARVCDICSPAHRFGVSCLPRLATSVSISPPMPCFVCWEMPLRMFPISVQVPPRSRFVMSCSPVLPDSILVHPEPREVIPLLPEPIRK